MTLLLPENEADIEQLFVTLYQQLHGSEAKPKPYNVYEKDDT